MQIPRKTKTEHDTTGEHKEKDKEHTIERKRSNSSKSDHRHTARASGGQEKNKWNNHVPKRRRPSTST
jgi:hypothetical protein